jgi:alpha-ribazole phosphatase
MNAGIPTLDLLRHGEVEGGRRFRGSTDDPLTAEGWNQLRAAAAAHGPWDRIVTSPLQRCRKFAEGLAAETSLPLTVEPRLAELHFGEWEGLGFEELCVSAPLALRRFVADPFRHPPPGAESLPGFRQRTLAALADLARHAGGRVLAVTHGGVIRMLLCHVREWPEQRFQEIEVDYAALFRLRLQDGQWCE